MKNRKIINKYCFSVEGETEKLYFEWLQNEINNCADCESRVNFDCKIEKNPVRMIKKLSVVKPTEVWHICDVESADTAHINQLCTTIDSMEKACKIGKQIEYKLGYTNYTFELWLILHKGKCNTRYNHRSDYLAKINSLYNENFENLHKYKKEKNFKKCLSKLDLNDVIDAIDRAEELMQRNVDEGFIEQNYKKIKFYKENPSLEIHKIVKKILKDCNITRQCNR